ncbi:fluoride efflux transporter CrcB [Alkalihalobacillus sp. NPDC078783]
MISAYIACAGGLGALSRYVLSVWLSRLPWSMAVPLPIILINILGAFLLGFVHAHLRADLESVGSILTTGFLGAFTTFSTFSMESLELFMQKRWKPLLVYVSGSILGCILFYLIGFYLY